MAGSSGGEETNYWPGFVDALSNVVLTLVFVLVIFVFALVMASNKVEEKMKQVAEAQKSHEIESVEIEHMKKQVEQLQKQLQLAQQNLPLDSKSKIEDAGNESQSSSSHLSETKEIIVQNDQTEEHEGAVNVIEANKNKLSIVFPTSVYKMDSASVDDLSTTLDGLSSQVSPTSKIVIRSIQGNETYTVAQRLAYYRALSIRNFLISKRGVDPSLISSQIVKPEISEEGRVEILFVNE